MRVLVVGAGPAGLYFSYLFKRANPRCEVRVVEQNPPDATFGFGVVFSDKALEFLRGGEPVVIDGIGFSAIGRLKFLRLMQQRAASAGVVPQYLKALSSVEELKGY